MRPFSFLHAADLHLDTPFSGIGRDTPELRERLRDATLTAFGRLVRLAVDQRVDFAVIAGDVYDGPERGVRAGVRFADGMRELAAHGIPAFIALGNHDPLGSRSAAAFANLPPLIKIFGERPESFPVLQEGEIVARVHGASYERRETSANLAAEFARHPDRVFQVGVLHATVGAHAGHEAYAPAPMETLVASGLDYWALGHVHTRAVLRERHPTVAYPGNLQALSPRETGPRGAYVVRVDEDGEATLSFHPLDAVRFALVEADASDLRDEAALRRRLTELAAEARREAAGRDLLLRGAFTGATPLHAALSRPAALAELLQALRDAEDGDDVLTHWLSIENRAAPPIDLTALRGQDGLPAALLAQADRLEADHEALAELLAEAWREFDGHDRAGRTFGPPPPEELPLLLAQACQLALERLLGEDPA